MKRSNYKKAAAILCTSVMMLSFTSCSREKVDYATTDDGSIPAELSIFCALGSKPQAAGAETFNEVESFKLMEELTGCKVNWIHPQSAAVGEKFNLMIASGEYPDAIVYQWNKASGGVASYVDDGVIIPLTDYVEECMPNFYGYVKDNPEVLKQCVNDDGDFLTIPYIRKDKELNIYLGPQIRTDWLKKLGLETPKTTEDLYNVLKAFKTQDPNGNGKEDEIPMSGIAFDQPAYGIGNLMWAFGTTYDFCLKDGKVVYGPMQPEFKTGLEFIIKLYKEGLIDRDYLLNDNQRLKEKVAGDLTGFLFGFQPSTYYELMNDGKREMMGIEYLTGPDGKNECYQAAYTQSVLDMSFAVTTANKKPKGTLKWLDNFFGGKGADYMNFGKEGLSYEMVDDYPTLTDYILNNPEGKSRADMIGMTIAACDSAFPTMQDYRYYKQTLSDWGKKSIEIWSNDDANLSNILPTLTLKGREEKDVADIMVQVEAIVSEAINKIIIGQSDISSWDKTIEQINKLGVNDAVKAYQGAYERYMAR